MLRLRCGRFAEAARVWSELLADDPAPSAYAQAALAFMRDRAKGLSPEHPQLRARVLFGDSLAAEVRGDLEAPDRIFHHYRLPICGDCTACPVAGECLYEAWSKVSSALRSRAEKSMPSQEALGAQFQRIRRAAASPG